MGKSSPAPSTNTVVQNSQPPQQWLNAYTNLTTQAQNQAAQPLQQYSGQLVAPFSPDQLNAQGIVQAMARNDPTAGVNAEAIQAFNNATQPLWPSIPQIDAGQYASWGGSNLLGAGELAQGAPQNISGAISPYLGQQGSYASTAQGLGLGAANTNIAGAVAPSSALATGLGLGAAGQNIAGAISPYAGIASNAATGLPGNTPTYADLGTYFNPYQSAVTSATQALFNEQNAEQQSQVAGNAAAAGAFGGDRQAVAQALTARQQQLAQAPVLAGIQQQGFAQAQQELNAEQQLAQQQAQIQGTLGLGAGQLVSGAMGTQGQLGLGAAQAALGAGQLTSGALQGQGQLGLGAGQISLGAGQQSLGAAQAEAGALGTQGQLSLGAAQALAGIGQQQLGEFNTQQQTQLSAEQATDWLNSQAAFGLGNLGQTAQNERLGLASALNTEGGQEQAQAQQELNIPYEQFIQQQAYPYQQLNWLSGIPEGTGALAGGSGSTSYPGPSPVSQIAGLGLAGTGIIGATGGFGANGWLTSGLGSLFGSGALSAGEAGALNGFGDAFAGAAPFALFDRGGGVAKRQAGGLVPGYGASQPGLGASPGVPQIGSYITMPGSTNGPGPPKPPMSSPQTLSSSGMSPLQFFQTLNSMKGLGVFDTPGVNTSPVGNQLGGRIAHLPGISGSHFGRGLGSMHEIGLGHGLSQHPGGLGRRMLQVGGAVSPLTAAAPLSGTTPNTQGFYQGLTQRSLEQLRELAVRFPPNTQQGALIQRAIQAKEMTPGAGIALQQPQFGQPSQPTASASPMQDGGGVPPALNYMLDQQLWGGMQLGGSVDDPTRPPPTLASGLGAPASQGLDLGKVDISAPTGSIASAPPPTPPTENREQTVNWWMKNAGVPEHVAQGIADNVQRESGFDPTNVSADKGGPSVGLYQAHLDRAANLQQHPNWQDPNVQHAWALSQVTGGVPVATQHWNENKSAPTREAANGLWKKYFERPADSGDHLERGLGTTKTGMMIPTMGGRYERSSGLISDSGQAGLANPPAAPPQSGEPKGSDFLQSPWMIPIAIGAGMLSSRSPFPGVALGEGLETGLKYGQQQEHTRQSGEVAEARMQTAQQAAARMADLADFNRAKLAQQQQFGEEKLGQAQQKLDLTASYQGAILDLRKRGLDETEAHHAALEQLRESAKQNQRPIQVQDVVKDGQSGTLLLGPDGKEQGFYPTAKHEQTPANRETQIKDRATFLQKQYELSHPFGASPGEQVPDFMRQAEGEYGRPGGTAPAAGTSSPAPQQWTRTNPLVPKTQADIDNAPAGSIIQTPNGLMVKP